MKYALIIAAALAISSCGGNQHHTGEPLAESGRTVRTEQLLENLKALGDSSVYLFGHHDDTVYGIGWEADYSSDSTIHQRSDVKSVCNDYPALLGFDLGHIELGHERNIDGVPFSRIRQEVIAHFDRGGMITLTWHPDNLLTGGTSSKPLAPKTASSVFDGGKNHELFLTWLDRVADFLNSLETPYGVRVPVVFRPWHQPNGSRFWWGQQHCTPDEYKSLWRITAERLRAKGVVNVLYAYSPIAASSVSAGGATASSVFDDPSPTASSVFDGGNEESYLERYPGDDIIDIMGLDSYCIAPNAAPAQIADYAAQTDKSLEMVCRLAHQHHKAAALTETGYEGIKTADWWTKTLAPVLARHPICYVLVGRNANNQPGHFFAPYPGQSSSGNFVSFYNDPGTLFLSDVNALYLKRPGSKKP